MGKYPGWKDKRNWREMIVRREKIKVCQRGYREKKGRMRRSRICLGDQSFRLNRLARTMLSYPPVYCSCSCTLSPSGGGGGWVNRILLSAFGRCPDRDVVQCSTADARTSIRPQLAFDDQGPFQGEDRKGHGFLDGSTNNRRSGACWRAAVVD